MQRARGGWRSWRSLQGKGFICRAGAPTLAELRFVSLTCRSSLRRHHEMLRNDMVMHDLLYTQCMTCLDETHNWPPRM